MAKASKHKRCDGVRKSVFTAWKDSISELPSPILCHILSYLPTKDAVRTSVLSKLWSDVWTSIPCIDIDDDRSFYQIRDSFMDSVDRVLRLNDVPCLRRLHISFNVLHNLSRARELINAVIMRDAEELDVAFLSTLPKNPKCLGKPIELPPRLFTTSEKLVILKLKNCCNITLNVPTSVYLPCLKILHLHQIRLLNNDFVKDLLDGCPVIEELDINIEYVTVRYKEGKTLLVRSSSLKSLRVQTRYLCFDQVKFTIVVDAQNLEQIDIKDDLKIDYDMVNLSSLVEVKFDSCKGCSTEICPYNSGDKSLQLLRTLSNTHLFLSCQSTQNLAHAHWDDLPTFHSLKHLELKTRDYSWSVMYVLLECSPNLRTLVVHKEKSREDEVQFQEAKKCLKLKLEEIELKGFKGWAVEMEMVRYFLKNATVLKKMSIQSYFSGLKKHSEISKELLTFARGSNECQIIFG